MAPMKEMVKKGTGSGTIWTGLDSIGNGYRLCIVGDLNGWIGNRTKGSITGSFGVPGENVKGQEGVEVRGVKISLKMYVEFIIVKNFFQSPVTKNGRTH